jgi:alkylated DNA nucleotide flippase Atl1
MTALEIAEALSIDAIVPVGAPLRRQFGAWAKMLKPSRASVEALVAEIPPGAVATTTLLRQILAERLGADTTCPFLTKRALLAIAADPTTTAPYWRAVMADGALLPGYPGGVAGQAERLRGEGVAVAGAGKTAKVAALGERLAVFGR